ncbi:carbonic anhydrase 4b [Electrophorus electricus]|uniref:carbonic anhydrase 4b n=1 Tax=Electrophorus electricus TaxID=8005 RepID=UPI0015D03BEC|nr:carbonic anhydrase 4b [Electrophorus electricus]
MPSFYLRLLFVSLLRTTLGAEWCYESQFSCDKTCKGPRNWIDVALSCGGTSQSPINIVTQRAVTEGTLTPLTFRGYQDMFDSIITNNGHTVKVNLSGHALVEGGDLQGPYKAVEFHFHWGRKGGPGSEHTVDGQQFPMEMHIVHIKDKYSSVSEAVADPSGVAVLGVLYQESEARNKKYETLINALAKVTQQDTWSRLGPLSLELLIPAHKVPKGQYSYFRYTGSLTTPDCAESVIWTVLENTVHLSKQQLSAFSDLMFGNGSTMVETFRPVQPLNNRRVLYYSGCNAATVSNILVINTVLTMLLTVWE